MSLGSAGSCTIGNIRSEGRRANLNILSSVNDCSDIAGTKPQMKGYQYTNKPKLWDDTSDIKGSVPMRLHPHNPNKVIGRNLNNDDIEGSKPQAYTFRTKRNTNPAVPHYVVPGHTEHVPIAEPRKQLVQTNQTCDIEGAGPRIPIVERYAIRDNYNVADIDGCTSTWKPRHQRRDQWKSRNTSYDCSDINDKRVWSNRVSDPLDPCHVIHGRVISRDPKSKPRGIPKPRDGGMMPVLSLTTQDIEGAVPGWKPKHVNGGIPEEHRRHFRNINYVGDIDGAKADSLVRNMPNYGRRSNPLDPDYTDLDGGPLIASSRLPDQPHEFGGRQPTTSAWGEISEDQRHVQEKKQTASTVQQQKELEQDRLIQSLQEEMRQLRAERDGLLTNRSMSSRAGSARGSMHRGGSSRGGNTNLVSRGSSTSRGSQNSSQSIHQCGSQNGSAVDRMVLNSRNGFPRVNSTPSERRENAQLASDIESVRSL
jgi:hypothetical protein